MRVAARLCCRAGRSRETRAAGRAQPNTLAATRSRAAVASYPALCLLSATCLGVPLYVNEWGWESIPWSWQGATEPVRDAAIKQVTEQLGQNPYVADVEPYCWGCSDAFNIYGTPAATAFEEGIAAARSSLAVLPTAAAMPVSFTREPATKKGRHRHRHRPRHRHRHRHRQHHSPR